MPDYDCQNCGACCVNDVEFAIHPSVTKRDVSRLSDYYRRNHVLDSFGNNVDDPSEGLDVGLRMIKGKDGFACVAFRGQVGGPCSCFIYDRRPEICQKFKPGGVECKYAREVEGL